MTSHGFLLALLAPLLPLLCGCALDLDGLQRDEPAQGVPITAQSMEPAADGAALPSADVVVEAPRFSDATSDAADAPAWGATPDGADTDATPEDAHGERGDANRGGDAIEEGAGRSEAGSDAPSCVLPEGATTCCGSVPCADDKIACSSPSVCEGCQRVCVDSAKPICCPSGALKVTCVAKPNEC